MSQIEFETMDLSNKNDIEPEIAEAHDRVSSAVLAMILGKNLSFETMIKILDCIKEELEATIKKTKVMHYGLKLIIKSNHSLKELAQRFLDNEYELLLMAADAADGDLNEYQDISRDDILKLWSFSITFPRVYKQAEKNLKDNPYYVTEAQKAEGLEHKIQLVVARCQAMNFPSIPEFQIASPRWLIDYFKDNEQMAIFAKPGPEFLKYIDMGDINEQVS